MKSNKKSPDPTGPEALFSADELKVHVAPTRERKQSIRITLGEGLDPQLSVEGGGATLTTEDQKALTSRGTPRVTGAELSRIRSEGARKGAATRKARKASVVHFEKKMFESPGVLTLDTVIEIEGLGAKIGLPPGWILRPVSPASRAQSRQTVEDVKKMVRSRGRWALTAKLSLATSVGLVVLLALLLAGCVWGFGG